MISLTSPDFGSPAPPALQRLWEGRAFTDVTLATEDGLVEAHRAVLAATSPFFASILERSPARPVTYIYLGGLEVDRLDSILRFLYLGQVEVAEAGLEGFLRVAGMLGLAGLEEQGGSIQHSKEKTGATKEEMDPFEEINIAESFSKENEVKLEVNSRFPLSHLLSQVEEHDKEEMIKCQSCGQSFTEKSVLNLHMATCKENQSSVSEKVPSLGTKFSCNHCDFSVLHKISLNKHLFENHGGNVCGKCQFRSKTISEMNQHNLSHGSDAIHCTECDKLFTSNTGLKSHMKNMHSPDIVHCYRCKVKFINLARLEEHLPICTVFPCDLCDYGAPSEPGLLQHKQFKHEGIRYNCELCTYRTGFQGQMTMHMMAKHKNGKKAIHGCDQCQKRCSSPSGLELHKRLVHGGGHDQGSSISGVGRVVPHDGAVDEQGVIRFRCDFCEYSATTRGNLMMHKRNKHN